MKLELNPNGNGYADIRKEGTHYCAYIHQKGKTVTSLQCRPSIRLALADALIYGVKHISNMSGQDYDQTKLDKMLNQDWFDNLEDYLKSNYVSYFN